ncbi:hypothetical protein [Rhodopirellula bahusiensis]|uniref:hypothetical protein n=5 Tax=Rhodopirellula bahusiensis TaxID=2014065 RepID=UPI0032651EC4
MGLSPANQCDPPGIPYYLPKPLLVVAKNVRHIDESKVGLTGPAPIPGGFDNQAAYADIKANVTVPNTGGESGGGLAAASMTPAALSAAVAGTAGSPSTVAEKMTPDQNYKDGITPDSFFTYQVIFVPDLTQKYGLQISGGAGEFRAAMNMVNGWMYTGMGPFYMKDSSSAQNAMATGVAAMYAGRGVSDVVDSVGGLTTAIGNLPGQESGIRTDGAQADEFSDAVRALELAQKMAPKVHRDILNYAEVYIYEPVLLPDGQTTEWRQVAEHHFDRHYFDTAESPATANQREQVMQGLLRQAMGVGESGAVEPVQPPTFDQPTTETLVLPPPTVDRLDPPSNQSFPFEKGLDLKDGLESEDNEESSKPEDAMSASATEAAVRIRSELNQQQATVRQREAAVRQRSAELQSQESAIRQQQVTLSEREAEVRIRENGQNFAMGMFNRTAGFQPPNQGDQPYTAATADVSGTPVVPNVVQMNVHEAEPPNVTRGARRSLRELFHCEPEERPTVRSQAAPQRVILP